jgi:hypothetical protein
MLIQAELATVFNMWRPNLQKSDGHGSGVGQKTESCPFVFEMTIASARSFYDILLEAIDEAGRAVDQG